MSLQAEFQAYRSKMNARILGSDSKVMKRIYSLDTLTYQAGALDVKTKELMGLCVSLSMRCDSCVKYHIEQALQAGASEAEITVADTPNLKARYGKTESLGSGAYRFKGTDICSDVLE